MTAGRRIVKFKLLMNTVACFFACFSNVAHAELRAFKLKIVNTAAGTERYVVTRFDHVQYPMYNFVARTETIEIAQTWMCYSRSDYANTLCPAPASDGRAGGAANIGGGPGVMNSGASIGGNASRGAPASNPSVTNSGANR